MKDLMKELREFARERDWEQFHSPKNLAMALAVEAAELMEHFQWLTEEQSRQLEGRELEEVGEEVGDVLIYLLRFCDRLGVDPLEAARAKVGKNRGRYPVEKSRGRADKYTRL